MSKRAAPLTRRSLREMAELKDRLRNDLSAAIKSRDTVTVATLRMALAAITTE